MVKKPTKNLLTPEQAKELGAKLKELADRSAGPPPTFIPDGWVWFHEVVIRAKYEKSLGWLRQRLYAGDIVALYMRDGRRVPLPAERWADDQLFNWAVKRGASNRNGEGPLFVKEGAFEGQSVRPNEPPYSPPIVGEQNKPAIKEKRQAGEPKPQTVAGWKEANDEIERFQEILKCTLRKAAERVALDSDRNAVALLRARRHYLDHLKAAKRQK